MMRRRMRSALPTASCPRLWEALSPDPVLGTFRDDYHWLTDVYESVRPSDIAGRLVWHALGAKTVDLINEHAQVEIPKGA
jgi:type I restriction enzyme, R subunit